MIQSLSEKDRKEGFKPDNYKDNKYLRSEKLNSSNGQCAVCGGSGFVIKNSSKYQDTIVFCKCREMDKTRVLWKNSGIETEKNRLTFGNYKIYNRSTEKAKEAAIDYFKNFNNIRSTRKNSIAFLGQVGSGKTHISVAIGLNLLAKNIPVVYMSYRDEILKLKQNILDEEYYASCLRRYKLSEVLIIDDLFKGKINESDINIIFEIINYRYMNNRPIIVSSEFTAEKLLYFDEGVGSRIIEMCKDYMVEIERKENNYRVNS